jgi:hypothetical protein
MEFILILQLADVETWLEGRNAALVFVMRILLAAVGVEVVKQTEEGGEALLSVESRESHCGCCVGDGADVDWLESNLLNDCAWKS